MTRPRSYPKQIAPGRGLVFLTAATGGWLALYGAGYCFWLLLMALEGMAA